jgi:hypothetical protein
MRHALVVIGIVLSCVVVGVLSQSGCGRQAPVTEVEPQKGPAGVALEKGPRGVTVILNLNEKGEVVKDLYPPQALVYCGHRVTWVIHNGTDKDAKVEMSRFTVLGTQPPTLKDPIDFRETSISVRPGEEGSIRGTVKDKAMLDAEPRGKRDAFGQYQDFKYSLVVDGKDLDPEVRVRE